MMHQQDQAAPQAPSLAHEEAPDKTGAYEINDNSQASPDHVDLNFDDDQKKDAPVLRLFDEDGGIDGKNEGSKKKDNLGKDEKTKKDVNDLATACQPVVTDLPLQTDRVMTENDGPEPLLSPSTPKVKDFKEKTRTEQRPPGTIQKSKQGKKVDQCCCTIF